MNSLNAIFEEWYLGDGTYPYLKKDQKVNLSFYLNPKEVNPTEEQISYWIQENGPHSKFCGRIVYLTSTGDCNLAIIDTGLFKFYIEASETQEFHVGQHICGEGELLVDYYAWVENVRNLNDAPDIFYSFQIEQILRIKIPQQFVNNYADGSNSYPSSLLNEDYSDIDISEIQYMSNEDNQFCFYLLNLKTIKEDIARTFIS